MELSKHKPSPTHTASPATAALPAQSEPMLDMNMTPMIDVMLVLIIMFIMTLPIAENAVTLNTPSACVGECAKPEVVRVDVDFDGTLSWNGEVLDRSQLDSRFDALSNMAKQPEVQLLAHKLAAYKYVAGVLASAQNRGVKSLGIIGSEQFMPKHT